MDGKADPGRPAPRGVSRKSPTLHDFPYDHPRRKCYHKWIINVAPPGRPHCAHDCLYCYAREAVYARDRGGSPLFYAGLAGAVEAELGRLRLCPPVSLSNATDPCQPAGPLRDEVARLVRMLLGRGVSLSITTKGDPSFLADLPGFAGNPRVFTAITLEGPREVLRVLSPRAPAEEERLAAMASMRAAGVPVVARIDPVLPHLWRAVYGGSWTEELEGLVERVAQAGAGHVISSAGTLGAGACREVHRAVRARSRPESEAFLRDYLGDRAYPGVGRRLVLPARLEFHRRMRSICEARGMTYAACIELGAGEADTPGLPHCEAFPAPFCLRDRDGYFRPLDGCTANCFVNCRGLRRPPCGEPRLAAAPAPYRASWLR